MRPRYSTAAFDLDGTLLDTGGGIIGAVKAAVRELGYPMPSDEKLRTFIGPPMSRSMSETFGLDKDGGEYATDVFRRYYADEYMMIARPYDGLFDLLEALKENSVKLGVATFKREDYGVKILENFDIAPYLHAVCGDTSRTSKTKSQIVSECLNKLSSSPESSVYVGDTMGDLIGAVDAGTDFIAVTFGFGFKKGVEIPAYKGRGPVFVADSMKELQEYLLGCGEED